MAVGGQSGGRAGGWWVGGFSCALLPGPAPALKGRARMEGRRRAGGGQRTEKTENSPNTKAHSKEGARPKGITNTTQAGNAVQAEPHHPPQVSPPP